MNNESQSDITISVIVPAFNASNLIRRSLDSIAKQTLLPTEVIVIDDGSSDDTYEVASLHPISELVQFKVLKKENGGQASARNLGILTATSKYIALLDADDEFLPNHVKNLSDAANKHPDATLIFAAIERIFDTPELAIREHHLPDFRKIALSHCDSQSSSLFKVMQLSLFQDLLKGSFITTSSLMFLRIVKNNIVLFDEFLKYAEDRSLYICLAALGNLVFIDEVSCYIYRTGNNISNGKNGLLHATYSVKVLEGLLDQHLFSTDSLEKKLVMNELSSRVDDLLYFSSHNGIKLTISAVQSHWKWTTKKFPIWLYAKRLGYATFVSLGLLT